MGKDVIVGQEDFRPVDRRVRLQWWERNVEGQGGGSNQREVVTRRRDTNL